MGGTVERAEKVQVERVISHSMKERFSLETAEPVSYTHLTLPTN